MKKEEYKVYRGKLTKKKRAGTSRKRKIFAAFVKNERVYLTQQYLRRVIALFDASERRGEIITTRQAVRLIPKIAGCTDPAKGFFSDGKSREEFLASVRKPVKRIHPKTEREKVYNSIGDAAKDLKEFPYAFKGISRALNIGCKAYGYLWKAA